jgi:hypothetical protein
LAVFEENFCPIAPVVEKKILLNFVMLFFVLLLLVQLLLLWEKCLQPDYHSSGALELLKVAMELSWLASTPVVL